MYAGPQVNHEEYLLGRKIDKNIDVLKEDDSNKVIVKMYGIFTFKTGYKSCLQYKYI